MVCRFSDFGDNNNANGVCARKVNPLDAINVNDIENVDVLKGASAAAIYGSRGSTALSSSLRKEGRGINPW